MSTNLHALTMRLRDGNTVPMPAQAQMRFESGGGSIGRGAACDWVLEADGVSRLHASVRCLDGLFFIEDHSTNGVLHNGVALRPGLPVALKNGDAIKIDVFEIDVAIGGPAHAAPAPESNAHLPDVSIAVLSGSEEPDYLDEHDIHSLLAGPKATVSVDPLALLDRADTDSASGSGTEWSMGAWNHAPPASAAYRSPTSSTVPPPAAVLPENWDLTRTQYAPEPVPTAKPAASVPPVAAPAYADTAPAPHATPRIESLAEARIESPLEPHSEIAALEDSTTSPRPSPAAVSAAKAVPARLPTAPPRIPDPHATSRPATATETSSRSAPAIPPERRPADGTLATSLLATTIGCVMDLLRARAEFKNGLRLPSTLVQRRENNPLKFAPSVDEAIDRLLGPGDGAYLAGHAAIEDAMRDIRHHQLALLAAMRIALDNAFEHFDPAHFEAEGNGKAGLGAWSGKPWRRYREHFRSLADDPEARYRNLFGDEFARAYEEQMSQLKTGDTGAHWSGRS